MTKPRLVVITGVTKGIGLSLTKWFIENGHKVIGCGRSEQKISNLNTLFANGGSFFSVVDVSSQDSVEDWAKKSIASFGAPDLLVNNAAVVNKLSALWDVPLSEFDKVVDVNIKGVNNVIHFFVPAMIKAGKGVIINLSSCWGRSTAEEVAPYCCSKWGVEGLSMALAKELPPPLACVPLNPGIINTDMLQEVFGENAKNSRGPDDWANSAGPFLLALDRSSNGKQLTVS